MRPIWSVSAESPSYPIIAEDRVVVTERGDENDGTRLVAFDARSGREAWSHPISGTYFWSNAAYDGGRLFVVNFDGLLRAFQATDGAQLWTVKMPDQYAFSAPPTAVDGVVYLLGGGSAGTLYAVNESDGTVVWTADAGGDGSSSPSVAGGRIAVSAGCGTSSFDLAGNAKWSVRQDCPGIGASTSAVWEEHVYSRVNGGVSLALSDGSVQGAFASDLIPAFAGGLMYTVNGGRLDALEATTGVERWHVVPRDPLVTAPLVMGDWVVAAGGGGTVYAFDRDTGATVWSDRISSTIAAPDEQDVSLPLTGLGAAGPLLVVPTTNRLAAYRASGPWNIATAPTTTSVPTTPAPASIPSAGTHGVQPSSPRSLAATPSRGVGPPWFSLLVALLLGVGLGVVGVGLLAGVRSRASAAPRGTQAERPPVPPRPDGAHPH
jgi:outer membrane protein assembly factor BamB